MSKRARLKLVVAKGRLAMSTLVIVKEDATTTYTKGNQAMITHRFEQALENASALGISSQVNFRLGNARCTFAYIYALGYVRLHI